MKKRFWKQTTFAIFAFFAMSIIASFCVTSFASGIAYAGSRNGGLMYVGQYTTYGITDGTTLSGSTATNGGGIYVNTGGTLNISGGAIYGNTATSNGNNIYNAGTTNITGGVVANKINEITRYDADGNVDPNGAYIYFGSYPQTVKASGVSIDETKYKTLSTGEKYYLGSDNEYYAKFTANTYNSSYVFSDGTTIVSGTDYYFKVEPIKWRILSEDNGQAIILSELILDVKCWDENWSNSYEDSTVRAFLNGYAKIYGTSYLNCGFYQQAFTTEQQVAIQTTIVDNSAQTTKSSSNTNVCENTEDKVWLLSYQDLLNTSYAFQSNASDSDSMRIKRVSDYSRANYNTFDETGNGQWWTRSLDEYPPTCGLGVLSTGNCGGCFDSIDHIGVVPAMTISLNTDPVASDDITDYGIYNTGELNIYGGSVYDHIYSSGTLNTKVGANVQGTITLADSATIVVEDYAGVTPNYKINLSSTRGEGAVITFVGSDTLPDISAIIAENLDENHDLEFEKDANGNWCLMYVLRDTAYEFPRNWKSEISSTSYMMATLSYSELTEIKFVYAVPTGYFRVGTLSTGLPVYQSTTTSTDIAFVAKKIFAPESCYQLFYDCSGLTSLDLSNFYTSNVTSMSSMFSNCLGLTSLDVSNFNTSNVTSMSSMFSNCSGLTSLDLSNFNTFRVIYMACMFFNCSRLTELDLTNFNISNLTSTYEMFCNCSGLTELDLINFKTSKVKTMERMFYNCSGLTELDVSKFDTSKVTNMRSMFSDCLGLTSLDVSNFDTSNVTSMWFMFYNCSGLTSLDISNFDTSNVTSMNYMFFKCSSLTSLDLSSFNMINVTAYSSMLYFSSSNKIQTLKTPYNNTGELTITTGSTLYYNGSVVTSVPAGLTASQTYTASASGFVAGRSAWCCSVENNLNLQNSQENEVLFFDKRKYYAKVELVKTCA